VYYTFLSALLLVFTGGEYVVRITDSVLFVCVKLYVVINVLVRKRRLNSLTKASHSRLAKFHLYLEGTLAEAPYLDRYFHVCTYLG